MDDGLVALLTEIRQKPFDWQGIARRMGSESCYAGGFPGKAAKYALRILVESFIKSAPRWAETLELPETNYSYCEEKESRIFVNGKNRQSQVTIFDSALSINGVPVVVDIRMSSWKHVRHDYFNAQSLSREVVLEDMFGKRGCDRVLIVPDMPPIDRFGVHIASPSLGLQQYLAQADAMGRKYNLIKAKNQASDST